MINRIIEFSANNKILVFALLAAACLWGAWSAFHLPLDAIPDLSETQVIVLSRWDRSPDIIEDQVTYPILSAMTGAPKVRTVRGISDFGRSYGIPISRVAEAVREGNRETGARLLEFGGAEYMIRGRGYLSSTKDIEETVLTAVDGTPIRIKDVARVVIGPDLRRGTTDLNGRGEVVSGIVVTREGSNALEVIDRVKARRSEEHTSELQSQS